MLTGRQDLKPDRMIRRFVTRAVGGDPNRPVDVPRAEAALRDALRRLQQDAPALTLLTVDHTLWRHESNRARRRGPGPER
jgi:hypothetical protein